MNKLKNLIKKYNRKFRLKKVHHQKLKKKLKIYQK